MSGVHGLTKVLYVGLDGCDGPTMESFAASGECPNLAALLARSAVVDTVAPYGTFVGSSWMTISTGVEVDTHRYWNWLEVDAGYATVFTTPRSVTAIPFWQQLSDVGRRVAVLDVPHIGLPGAFNGVVLKEWGCHDRHDGTASHPARVLEELDREVGRHPVGCRDHPHGHEAFAPCDYTLRRSTHRTAAESAELLALLRLGVERKRQASLRLLDEGGWDLFATVLGEAHCVGHQLWHLHDTTHPRHDAALRTALGDPVAEIYRGLDATIGALVDQVGPHTPVVLQMNHGMGPHFDGTHLFEVVAKRLDDHLAGRSASWARVRHVAAKAERDGARRDQRDRRRRRFFPLLGNTSVGALRFNVVGRDARGLVRPGGDLDAVRAAVTAELLDLRDPDTGRPYIIKVTPTDEVLARSADDRFPDLFVEWDRTALPERVVSPALGVIRRPYRHWRTGDHHPGGLFAVSGPGIVPGRRSAPMSLVDTAPTIAALLGVTLDGVDGQARTDLLGADV